MNITSWLFKHSLLLFVSILVVAGLLLLITYIVRTKKNRQVQNILQRRLVRSRLEGLRLAVVARNAHDGAISPYEGDIVEELLLFNIHIVNIPIVIGNEIKSRKQPMDLESFDLDFIVVAVTDRAGNFGENFWNDLRILTPDGLEIVAASSSVYYSQGAMIGDVVNQLVRAVERTAAAADIQLVEAP